MKVVRTSFFDAFRQRQAEAPGSRARLPGLEPPSRREVDRLKRQRLRRTSFPIALLCVICVLVLVAWSQRRDTRPGVRGYHLMEQGYALLDEHPMRALPYIVAARADGIESAALNMMFARAAGSAPLVTFVGHEARINSIAFSPDGKRLATTSDDRTARIWDTTTGKEVMRLQHRAEVHAAVFSPDGGRIVTSSNADDPHAQIWNVATGGSVTAPLELARVICPVKFSADGTRIITDGYGAARVWNATTGEKVTARDELDGVVFSGCESSIGPGGARYLGHELDNSATIREVTAGSRVTARLQHEAQVVAMAFSPDGTRVVTGSHDNTARVWDAASGAPLTAPLPHIGWVHRMAFSPDGTRIVTTSGGSGKSYARVWNATTGAAVTAPLEHRDGVLTAAFSADGSRIVTSNADGTARVWNATTGTPVTWPLDHENGVAIAELSTDATLVATTAVESKTVYLWSATEEKLRPPPSAVAPDGDACSGRPLSPSDMGSLDEWLRFARCTPFTLENDDLVINRKLVSPCHPVDCREESFLDFR
jgi:WD40 repeat protein